MKQSSRWSVGVQVALLVSFLGCPSTRQAGVVKPEDLVEALSPPTEHAVKVALPDGQEAHLGAELWRPNREITPKTVIVMIPGSGAVSRRGTQDGNGISAYEHPIEVNVLWAEALARAGFFVFSYDKRNCSPSHDRICSGNPIADLDKEGPKALRRDVDAVCQYVRGQFGDQVRIVLWADTQGVQVALSSQCKQNAAALVFVAPITERIDQFWVEGLFHASHVVKSPSQKSALQHKARNLQATFDSINKDLFEDDAKIMGVSLQYWKEWTALTNNTPSLVNGANQPMLLLIGAEDFIYTDAAKKTLQKLAQRQNRKFLILPDADHNLLQNGNFSINTSGQIVGALASLLKRD